MDHIGPGYEPQGLSHGRRCRHGVHAQDATHRHDALAVDSFEAEEAKQRGLELWTADEGTSPLLALKHAFGDQRIDGLAHRAHRQVEFTRQCSLGGDRLTRVPAVVSDLRYQMVA